MENLNEKQILLELYKGQQEMRQDIIKLYDGQQEMRQDLTKTQEDVAKTQGDLAELKEEVRRISRTVAKIEVEHGQKLDLLFDAITMHSEKFEEQKKENSYINKKLNRHDDEIYYLKSKVQGL